MDTSLHKIIRRGILSLWNLPEEKYRFAISLQRGGNPEEKIIFSVCLTLLSENVFCCPRISCHLDLAEPTKWATLENFVRENRKRDSLKLQLERVEVKVQRGVEFWRYGNIVGKPSRRSLKILTKAAEEGDRRAQYYLGRKYEFGEGIKKSKRKALFWYRKSADQGWEEALRGIERLGH